MVRIQPNVKLHQTRFHLICETMIQPNTFFGLCSLALKALDDFL